MDNEVSVEHGEIILECLRTDAPNIAVAVSDEVSFGQLLEAFEAFSLAVGYSPSVVGRWLNEEKIAEASPPDLVSDDLP